MDAPIENHLLLLRPDTLVLEEEIEECGSLYHVLCHPVGAVLVVIFLGVQVGLMSPSTAAFKRGILQERHNMS